eukprot:g7096.t1
MEYFADSPRFVRKRFHAEQEHLTHIQHSDTCRCLKCIKFAKTDPKLGIQIPPDVLEEVNKNRVSLLPEQLYCLPASTGADSRTKSSPSKGSKSGSKKEATIAVPERKFRDLQWLLMKMKGSVIVGVNTLYKDERGRQSYDIQLSTVVDPSGASRAGAADDASGATRKNELVNKMNGMVHRVLFPDTIFFDRGKPTQYFLTMNMDEDVSSAGQSGTESTVKMKTGGAVKMTSSDEQDKKKEEARKKKELKKQLDNEVEKIEDGLLRQRTLTALVKLRSSSELITIVRDFLRRALVLRRKQGAFEKLVAGMVKESKMTDEELQQAITANLNPRQMLNPYRCFLVPGREGDHYAGEMDTVYVSTFSTCFSYVAGSAAPGPHAVSTAVNPYEESLEILRIQYKDGTVRLWSDREVRMFCVLRKPNRQEFLDIQSVQILPFAGMHQTAQSLQFVTYNYNDKLTALKTKMRARSPKKNKVVYDPVPARPLSPKRVVHNPFEKERKGGQEEGEEEPPAEKPKKSPKKKSKDAAKPEGAAATAGGDAKAAGGDAKGDDSKAAGGATATTTGGNKGDDKGAPASGSAAQFGSPSLVTASGFYADPMASPHLSPDLTQMREYFPEAHLVMAEQYDDGRIMFQEEEAKRIRELQRSLSPERYRAKKKRDRKAAAEAGAGEAGGSAANSKEKAGGAKSVSPAKKTEQAGGSKSSTAGAGKEDRASSKTQQPPNPQPHAAGAPASAAAPAQQPTSPTKPRSPQPPPPPPPPPPDAFIKKKHEPLEHLGEIPETHFFMGNDEREDLMEETIDKLNGWLTEKSNLRIYAGIFEFAFAKIDVPSKEAAKLTTKKSAPQAVLAEKKSQRVQKTPAEVVNELMETRLRCYLINATKLVVGKADRVVKKEDRFGSPSSRATSPSPYSSEVDEDMYAMDSPGDDSGSPGEMSPDSRAGQDGEEDQDRPQMGSRKKKLKWKTEAGPEMLTNMVDLWEPIRLECSTDPLAEFKRQQAANSVNSVAMMVRATVDAAREGTPFDHVDFLQEMPAPCTQLDGKNDAPGKMGAHRAEAVRTEKARAGPIGALLSKSLLPRSRTEPNLLTLKQGGTSTASRRNSRTEQDGVIPIGPMGMGARGRDGLATSGSMSSGGNFKLSSGGVGGLMTPMSRGTRPTPGHGAVQQHLGGLGNTPGSGFMGMVATPGSSRQHLVHTGQRAVMEKVDVSKSFLGDNILDIDTTRWAVQNTPIAPLSPRKDVMRTTTDSLSDLLLKTPGGKSGAQL